MRVRVPASIANLGPGFDVLAMAVELWLEVEAEPADGPQWTFGSDVWRDPEAWEPLRRLPFKTMYVQPGHYLCMGDNSPESSDGRTWGTVPRRLMLGRAVLVHYPFGRAGRIR